MSVADESSESLSPSRSPVALVSNCLIALRGSLSLRLKLQSDPMVMVEERHVTFEIVNLLE